jgi:hypothetical protein
VSPQAWRWAIAATGLAAVYSHGWLLVTFPSHLKAVPLAALLSHARACIGWWNENEADIRREQHRNGAPR